MRRRVLLPVSLVVMVLLGWTLRRPVAVAVFSAAGRNEHCDFAGAVMTQTRIEGRSMWRSARVSVVRTDEQGFSLWRTPMGEYWAPSNVEVGHNVHEQVVDFYGTGPQTVRRGDVVLDCGANIGLFTRKALDLGASRVVAIEPSPEILECLRRNYRREIAEGKVTVVPEGVWDSVGKLSLEIDDQNRGADRIVAVNGKQIQRKAIEVPVTTIDLLVAKLGLERVDFIKMDIEGSEVPALRGARATLARFRPRLALASYHKPDDPVTILRAVRAGNAGYTTECGFCGIGQFQVQPKVMFFR